MATSSKTPTGGYFAGLDGIRAVAIVGVMLFHTHASWIPGGFMGVDLFFPLSGFLITWTLVGRFWVLDPVRGQLANFYARRGVRLLPAILTLVMAVLVYSATIAPEWISEQSVPSIGYVLTSTGNWATALHWPPGSLGIFGHTWSLAVEEQYYLIWPPILLVMLCRGGRRGTIGQFLLGLAVLDVVWRHVATAWGLVDGIGVYVRTDTHADGLLLGSAFAMLLSTRPGSVGAYRSGMRSLGFLGALAVVLLAFLAPFSPFLPFGDVAFTIELAGIGLIYLLVTSPADVWYVRVQELRPLRYVGRISYGLYVYHFPLYIALEQVPSVTEHPMLHWALMATLPFLLATLSFELIEQPVGRQYRRFRRRQDSRSLDGGMQAILMDDAGVETYQSRTAP